MTRPVWRAFRLDCSEEELVGALEGCIMTDLLPTAADHRVTISGKVGLLPKLYLPQENSDLSMNF